jgi:hypothetical protein
LFDTRHATKRPKGNVVNPHAVVQGHDAVAKFVKEDTTENQQDKGQPKEEGDDATVLPQTPIKQHPDHHQPKGGVDLYIDPVNVAKTYGVHHVGPSRATYKKPLRAANARRFRGEQLEDSFSFGEATSF